MDFFETVFTRRTVREYTEEKPSLNDLIKIVDAARLAPSATNSQNWRFLVVTNREVLKKMKDAVSNKYNEIALKMPNDELKQKVLAFKEHSIFFEKAPATFVIVEQMRESFMSDVFKILEWDEEVMKKIKPDSSLLSLGAAIENMSLAAHNLGWGTCWMAAPLVANDDFANILSLAENERVVTLLPIGKPPSGYETNPYKKDLSEVMEIIS